MLVIIIVNNNGSQVHIPNVFNGTKLNSTCYEKHLSLISIINVGLTFSMTIADKQH